MAAPIQAPSLLASVLLDAVRRRDPHQIASAVDLTARLPHDLDPLTVERTELLQAVAQDLQSEPVSPFHRELLHHLAKPLLRGVI